jgi:predicted actin-binding protein
MGIVVAAMRSTSIAGRPPLRSRWLLPALVAALLALPAAADGSTTTWGSNLSVTPTRDTANNISPAGHNAEDTSVWNTTIGGSDTAPYAPAGGQVLSVSVKGCAVEDLSAPPSQTSQGVPVNTILFQTLQPGGNMNVTATSGEFQLPFCSASVTPDTVSTFVPVHMCIAQGATVDFHDIGGFIPAQGGKGPWYPQGVPFEVLAPATVPLSSVASWIGVGVSTYGPGVYGPQELNPAGAGYGSVRGEELQLQVSEGTGEDAYGLCPGGKAVEPTNSNTVICVIGGGSTEGHPPCDGNGNPVLPPANQSPPKISGTTQVGFALILTHGTWSNSPGKYSDQWQRCDSSGSNCTAISGATNASYHPASADVGHRIRVGESASNAAGTTGPTYSSPSAVITAAGGGGGGSTGGGGGSTGGGGGSTGGSHSTIPALSRLSLTIKNGRVTLRYQDSLAGTTTITVLTVARHPRRVLHTTHRDPAGKHTSLTLARLKHGKYTLELQSVLRGKKGKLVKHALTIR